MGFKYINEIATPENIQKLLSFIDLAAGLGIDTNAVFDIGDKLYDSPQMQQCVQWTKEDPKSEEILQEKYIGPDYDLEAMLAMPKGSLGWTYARVLSRLGYDPKFYRLRPTLETDADYIMSRIRKTHDLHHILTGFSLDDYGEFGVISVTVAQTGYPGFLLIDLLGMVLQFFGGKDDKGIDVEYLFDTISAGIKMGRAAKPLFPVKWELGFDRSLDEWRQELNIKPVTEGIWSWYSRPELRVAIELD